MAAQDLFFDETPRGWLPWVLLAPALGLAFLIASDLIATPVLERVARLDDKGLPVDAAGFGAFLLASNIVLLALLLLWVRWIERRSVATIGWTGPHKLRRFLQGHAIGMLSILGIVLAIALAGGLAPSAVRGSVWTSVETWSGIVWLLPCFALQASIEELFFRGWLLSVVAKKLNVAVAVLLSTALFTLAHFNRGQPPLITLNIALFALFCCAYALRTRSVLGVMGWHSGWNWLLAVGFGLPVTGFDVGIPALLVELSPVGPPWLTGGADGPEGSVVCAAYFVGATLAAWVWKRAS